MNSENLEIEIIIDDKGNIRYEALGMKGKSCIEETKFLDETLGRVVERKHKREFYEQQRKTNSRVYIQK